MIVSMFTDGVETLGTVKRISMRLCARVDGVNTWHYYGTKSAVQIPDASLPGTIVEHPYIQIPPDSTALENENDYWYQIALDIARVRDGVGE